MKISGELLACNILLNFIGQTVPLLVGMTTFSLHRARPGHGTILTLVLGLSDSWLFRHLKGLRR